MTRRTWRESLPLSAGLCAAAVAMAASLAAAEPVAAESVRGTGVAAGLAVLVGAGDGAPAAELAASGRMLVHALAFSEDEARRARERLFAAGVHGQASVAVLRDARELPYVDRCVNLLVADLDALAGAAPAQDEILRVLGYGGAAWLRRGGRWAALRRPVPAEVDTWTHTMGDAARSAGSRDLVAGPPNAIRWITGPQAVLKMGGPRTSDGVFVQMAGDWSAFKGFPRTNRGEQPSWLWARDVNSGVLLWRTEAAAGAYPTREWGESFVASGGRVFAYRITAGAEPAALTAWDIRSGAVLRRYDRSLTVAKTQGRLAAEDQLALRLSLVAVAGGRLIQLHRNRLVVLDVASGEVLWQVTGPEGSQYRHAVVAGDALIALRADALGKSGRSATRHDPVFPQALECFDLATGARRWTFTGFAPGITAMCGLGGYADGRLPVTGYVQTPGKDTGPWTIMLIDTRTGAKLWERGPKEHGMNAAYETTERIIGDKLYWSWIMKAVVLDVATGETRGNLRVPHFSGCQLDCATPNWLCIMQSFVPLADGVPPAGANRFFVNRSFHGSCNERISPSYGSVYSLANTCSCEAILPGVQALYAVAPVAPVADSARTQRPSAPPLGALTAQEAAARCTAAVDWRKPAGSDAWLGSYVLGHQKWKGATVWRGYETVTTEAVPAGGLELVAHALEQRLSARRGGVEVWNQVAGGRIGAAPVVVGGRAVFGCHDGQVYAVDLATGNLAWRYLAAPADRRLVAFGQVESAWPVLSLIVHEGLLYCSAGRHPELDGGIRIHCIAPDGSPRWHVRVQRGLSTERLTPSGRQQGPGFIANGDGSIVINDALNVAGGKLLLRETPVVDLADPRDNVINEATLAPPRP